MGLAVQEVPAARGRQARTVLMARRGLLAQRELLAPLVFLVLRDKQVWTARQAHLGLPVSQGPPVSAKQGRRGLRALRALRGLLVRRVLAG